MLRGIFPAIPTCFNDRGDPDSEGQRKVIRFAVECGADGIVFPGVASEYDFLSAKERNSLIKLLVEEVDDGFPIVAGVSAQEPCQVIPLGEEAWQNGIAHLMLMAPYHLGTDSEKQQSFFEEIASALPGSEIIFQNAPPPIGAGLPPDVIIDIVRSIPAITYIKEETLPSGPTISAILRRDISHLKGVFGGGGARYIIDELNRGAIGAVPAVEITDLHAALFRAYHEGQLQKARDLYRISLPLLTAQKIYRMKLTKYVLMQRGVTEALAVRAPLPDLDELTRKDIDQMLCDLRDLNAFSWHA